MGSLGVLLAQKLFASIDMPDGETRPPVVFLLRVFQVEHT